MTDLLVSELYDRLTIQGEGQSIGKLCSFIRTFACPMHCRWCDSAFTWRVSDEHPHDFAPIYDPKQESKRISIEEITQHFVKLNPPMIVITGGEPMLQSAKLPELITSLINKIPSLDRIEIETAGIIWDEKLKGYPFVHFNVSPKLENSGNAKELRYKPDVLRNFRTQGATFKFVIKDEQDLEEVQGIVDEVKIHESKIYIMSEGITGDAINGRLQELAEKVIERRWNLTTRLHVLLWGTKRGV